MESKWKKVKLALGIKTGRVNMPRTLENDDHDPSSSPSSPSLSEGFSDFYMVSPVSSPTATSVKASHSRSRSLFSRSSSTSSSQKTCSICLATMGQGNKQAIFTAECSHSFHFNCITSNVKHGNKICPICRAEWKEIPVQFPTVDPPTRGRFTFTTEASAQNDGSMTIIRRLPPPRPESNRSSYQSPEPSVFDDDEMLDNQTELSERNYSDANSNMARTMKIKTYPQFSSASRFSACDNFNVLINLKVAAGVLGENLSCDQASRACVDLVTVLDVSGSMAGTKLALLKQAMGFVIQNLGSNDRLSVIAFSSASRRLFPLLKMSETGRQQALLAVNSLVANGGTNIAEGLRKGGKVLEDRKEKNPVGCIILLSDGQDTYTLNRSGTNGFTTPNYESLLPSSITGGDNRGLKIPVHAFGFGTDHDALAMHSIAEISGGTFSFIESQSVIQDAFAQCIGGILSVVVQELQVSVECVHPSIRIGSLKAGSYPTRVTDDARKGFIDVGDLYADEDRNFLVSLSIPTDSSNETSLLKVKCVYKDPLTKEMVTIEGEEVKITRPESSETSQEETSIEVDRERNRLQAAETMAKARGEAEQGELSAAIATLESCRSVLSRSVSATSGDQLCIALDAELKNMQERMRSRCVYEASGRAYILSGLSAHTTQRATSRGDSTDGASPVQSYKTPSMLRMVNRSQSLLSGNPSGKTHEQPKPR